MLIKTTDINVPKEDEHKFFSIFGDICDEISIEQVVPIWNDIDISDVKTEFDKGYITREKKISGLSLYFLLHDHQFRRQRQFVL